jgi:hypothetical protein
VPKERHPSEAALLDLARGLAAPADAAKIAEHLRTGCERCQKTYNIWRTVHLFREQEKDFEPPPEAVRTVKAAFEAAGKGQGIPKLCAFGRLIFDSFRQPLLAGYRGTMADARHLVYEVDAFSIDMRMEGAGETPISLTGQILKNGNFSATAGTVVALNHASHGILTQTTANAAGEFQLDFTEQRELTLYFHIPEEGLLAVALPVPAG